ncbi:hypothetical protein CDL15_Pgr019592 [Punica granatum]|uniref:Uncharacterized protein n=1 Tax=Punica granatum TaxID=22663 RepID=A0A218X7F9_PUNGR|nr:hypothetical protein CDL15_Pgr019592 [Punica granatum]
MVRCARCCLRKAMGVMNIVVTLCGIGMIIYSLWLQKMWEIGVSDLPSIANLPKPWITPGCKKCPGGIFTLVAGLQVPEKETRIEIIE